VLTFVVAALSSLVAFWQHEATPFFLFSLGLILFGAGLWLRRNWLIIYGVGLAFGPPLPLVLIRLL